MSTVSNTSQPHAISPLTNFSADAPGPSISIDAMLAYCTSRLNALGSNIDQYYAQQNDVSHRMEEVSDAMAFVRAQGPQGPVIPALLPGVGLNDVSVQNALSRSNAILAKYRSATSPEAKEIYAKEFQIASGFDISEVPADAASVDEQRLRKAANDGKIIASDDAAVNGRLEDMKEKSTGLSRNAELNMIGLQALVSQRQLAIQLTTQMLQTMHESGKGILGNIR